MVSKPLKEPKDFEKAVKVLLSKSAREFLLDMSYKLRWEPKYLQYFPHSVSYEVGRILSRHGIHWSRDILKTYSTAALKRALEKFDQSSLEKRSSPLP